MKSREAVEKIKRSTGREREGGKGRMGGRERERDGRWLLKEGVGAQRSMRS